MKSAFLMEREGHFELKSERRKMWVETNKGLTLIVANVILLAYVLVYLPKHSESYIWAHATSRMMKLTRDWTKKEGNIPCDLIAYHPRSPVISDRIVKRSNPSLSSKERHKHIVITTVHSTKPKFTKIKFTKILEFSGKRLNSDLKMREG